MFIMYTNAARKIFDVAEAKILLRQQFEVLVQEAGKKMDVSSMSVTVEPSLARRTSEILRGVGRFNSIVCDTCINDYRVLGMRNAVNIVGVSGAKIEEIVPNLRTTSVTPSF